MDENKEEKDESKEEGGKTTTTEGQSEMAPQDEDPIKKAFQSALNQNVADSELETKEKVPTDGHAMTARDDTPQQEAPAAGVAPSTDPAPPSDGEDDGAPAAAPTPVAQPTQGASPVATPPQPLVGKKILSGLQGREMTATPIDEGMRNEQPSSDNTGEEQQAVVPKKTSTKRKKTKKKTKKRQQQQQQMAPPPFYQFPFFAMLPQVQMQERRKRAKKKAPSHSGGDKPSAAGMDGSAVAPSPTPVPTPTPAPAAKATPPPPAPEAAAPKKIEAVKIQQKEDDNGYLNLADLQAEEKKLYGAEKTIGAPGEEYICLADANDAAGGAPPSKETTNLSGKAIKAPEPQAAKSPGLAAKSPAASKDEWQDAVLTPRPGAKEKPPSLHQKNPPPPHKDPPKKGHTTMTADASVSRKAKKGGAHRPGAPVNPRQLQHQPAPATSVGPHRGPKTPVRNPAKEVTPVKGQPTKRKTAAPVPQPVRPPAKGAPAQQPYADPKKKNITKDEFQDAVLTPIQKNPPKGGGTRR